VLELDLRFLLIYCLFMIVFLSFFLFTIFCLFVFQFFIASPSPFFFTFVFMSVFWPLCVSSLAYPNLLWTCWTKRLGCCCIAFSSWSELSITYSNTRILKRELMISVAESIICPYHLSHFTSQLSLCTKV
jgi:hypothetical protein